jgi:hypothetical protein
MPFQGKCLAAKEKIRRKTMGEYSIIDMLMLYFIFNE